MTGPPGAWTPHPTPIGTGAPGPGPLPPGAQHVSDPYFGTARHAGSAPPPHTGISRRAAAALALTVLLVAAVAVLNLVTVEKVIYRPGPVYDALSQIEGQDVITVDELEVYPTSGTLQYTTVVLQGGPQDPVTAWEWMLAGLDPAADVVDQELVYPEEVTPTQVQEQNAELMAESQQGAAVVALRAIGVEVPEDIKVAQIIVDAPASGYLEIDDEIVAVDGEPMDNPDEVREILQDYEGGDLVPFTLLRGGEELTIEVPTRTEEVPLPEGGTEARTVVGVYLASDFELPYDVSIDAGRVGGPSAGLMFSLAVYDKLTEGELTGGEHFAGTGTIGSDGTVGGISGVALKMVGAREAGADFFLAPAVNCGEVVGRVPDGLTVIRVGTFEEARAAVEQAAEGDVADLPTCEA